MEQKLKQQAVIEWLAMNIRAEVAIIMQLEENYGKASKEVKKKKAQIEDLRDRWRRLTDGQKGEA